MSRRGQTAVDAIVLRPELRDALEKNVEAEAFRLNDLVNKAVEFYIEQLQDEKLDREQDAYEDMHADLKEKYLWAWVAIHDRQLVDHDAELADLYHRVRARYGRTAVLVQQVKQHPVDEIVMGRGIRIVNRPRE